MPCQDGLEVGHEIMTLQLACGDIDADYPVMPRCMPIRYLAQCFIQHPVADVYDQTGFLRERQKVERTAQALFRVLPAQQGFHADYLVALQVDLGLVIQA